MNKHGTFQQRAGKLIETFIIDKYNYYPNKRQQTRGFFDAYFNEKLFEIKGVLKRTNRVTIKTNNHKQLLEHEGDYIFVYYDLYNSDKGLSIITDIQILNIIEMNSLTVDKLINEYGIPYKRNFKGHIKTYTRVNFNNISEVDNE